MGNTCSNNVLKLVESVKHQQQFIVYQDHRLLTISQ